MRNPWKNDFNAEREIVKYDSYQKLFAEYLHRISNVSEFCYFSYYETKG